MNHTAQQTIRKITGYCKALPVGDHVDSETVAASVGISADKVLGLSLIADELAPFSVQDDDGQWWGNPDTITLLKDGLRESA